MGDSGRLEDGVGRGGSPTATRAIGSLLEDPLDSMLMEEAQVWDEHVPVGKRRDVVTKVGHVCADRAEENIRADGR